MAEIVVGDEMTTRAPTSPRSTKSWISSA